MPEVIKTQVEFTTPWFDLLSKEVRIKDDITTFYSLKPLDYVTILPVTRDNEIVLVRQYRPAVEDYTMELPAGHVDRGESPDQAAKRELLEETGYRCEKVELLGTLAPDTGRLSNKLWCYFAGDAVKDEETIRAKEDADIETLLVDRSVLAKALADGTFTHALHIAVLSLARIRNKLIL